MGVYAFTAGYASGVSLVSFTRDSTYDYPLMLCSVFKVLNWLIDTTSGFFFFALACLTGSLPSSELFLRCASLRKDDY